MIDFPYDWMDAIFPHLVFWGAVAIVINEIVFRSIRRYKAMRDHDRSALDQ